MKRSLWLMVMMVLLVLGVTGCGTIHNGGGLNSRSIESELVGSYKSPIHQEGEITGQVPKVGDKIYIYAVIGRETRGPYENLIVYANMDGTDESFHAFSTWGFRFPGLDNGGEDMHRLYLVGKTSSEDDSGNVYNKLHFYKVDGME